MKRKLTQILRSPFLPALVAGFLALVCVAIFVIFNAHIEETALFTQFESTVRWIWVGLLFVGGLACISGVLSENFRLVGGGMSLLGSAYLIDAIGILSKGFPGILTGAMIGAAGIRLWFQSATLYVDTGPEHPAAGVASIIEQHYRDKLDPK